MPFTITKTLAKLRSARCYTQEALPNLPNIKVLLLTWEEDQDKPIGARKSSSAANINELLRHHAVIPFLIPTRQNPDDMLNETAEFIRQSERELETNTYLLICYAGRHAHYTHGYNLQPIRYDPDAFHWNYVTRALNRMSLDAKILAGPAAVEATGLASVLEYEDRVSPRTYQRKKYAHREVLCLSALYRNAALRNVRGTAH